MKSFWDILILIVVWEFARFILKRVYYFCLETIHYLFGDFYNDYLNW